MPPRARRSNKGAIRALERRLNGFNFRPKPDPPAVVSNPWNSIVVTYKITSATSAKGLTVTSTNIWKNLLNQMGINIVTNPTLAGSMRIRSIAAWSLDSESIILETFDFHSNSDNTLSIQEDFKAKNHFACVGYVWPTSLHNLIVNVTVDGKNEVNLCDLTFSNDKAALLHLQLLWRFRGTGNPGIPNIEYDILGEISSSLDSVNLN